MSPRSIALAVQQRQDAIDGALHAGRRRGSRRPGPAPPQARARSLGGRLGQLHAGDAARAPGDAAAADRRFEEGEALCVGGWS